MFCMLVCVVCLSRIEREQCMTFVDQDQNLGDRECEDLSLSRSTVTISLSSYIPGNKASFINMLFTCLVAYMILI